MSNAILLKARSLFILYKRLISHFEKIGVGFVSFLENKGT
jgi:hypothetical protein